MPLAPVLLAAVLLVLAPSSSSAAQQPPAASAPDLAASITQLGDLEHGVRMKAAQAIRRTPPAQAVPALLTAIERHSDQFVRFRALVLLSGFNHPRIADTMREATYDPNDRVRAVAYTWFEHHPDKAMTRTLTEALQRETSEFVRPSLVRALAALGADPAVRPLLLGELTRGEEFVRSAVIDALGDHSAAWAFDALAAIAREAGPLQDDAAVAMGKGGDKRALNVLAGLQQSAPREVQPAIAGAICLLGVNCEAHRGYLVRSLEFAEDTAGFQPLLRGSAAVLGELASRGDVEAATALLDAGIPARDPARAPIALAVAEMALRSPARLLTLLGAREDRRAALTLLAEGFDMLEEDFAEERFFAEVRKAYWSAAEGSPARAVAQEVIGRLDF